MERHTHSMLHSSHTSDLGEPKGFGFVEFELVEDARAALENMDDAELCGQVIHVKIAKAKAPTDRPGM